VATGLTVAFTVLVVVAVVAAVGYMIDASVPDDDGEIPRSQHTGTL
jgi:hypothetical protein